MNTAGPIQAFLARFRRELRVNTRRAERILLEVENHLVETADQLRLRGFSPEDAEREAVVRFGNPQKIAGEFRAEISTLAEEGAMLRLLTTIVAAFNCSIALLLGVHSVVVDDARPLWIGEKVLACLLVLAIGALTLHWLWSRNVEKTSIVRFLWGGALALFPLGAATVATTIRLAQTTGDWEKYMIVAGITLILQGTLTLLHLRWAPTSEGPAGLF